MESKAHHYLPNLRAHTGYPNLRFLIEVAAILGIATTLIMSFRWFEGVKTTSDAVAHASWTLVLVLLIFGGRELLRMLVDAADILIDLRLNPAGQEPELRASGTSEPPPA